VPHPNRIHDPDAIAEMSHAVLALVSRHFPMRVEPGDIEDWRVVGPALIAKAADHLRSITLLLPGRREADANILVRALYETVVLFAWIAIEPQRRVGNWHKRTCLQAKKAYADWEKSGIEIATHEELAAIDRYCSTKRQSLAPLPVLAEKADQHWGTRIPGFRADPDDPLSFRGFYRSIYRSGSWSAHTDGRSLRSFYTTTTVATTIHAEKPGHDLLYFGLAPYLMGLGLAVAGSTLGWPDYSDVRRALRSDGEDVA